MAKSKYQPLRDLGDDVLEKIEAQMKSGTSPRSVAKRLHVDHPSLLDYTESRLTTLLESYKKDFVDRAIMHQIEQSGVLKNVQRLAQSLSLYDEMMLVLAAQRNRVESALTAAEKMPAGMLVNQHGIEIERYGSMVDRVLRAQMEMGIVPRVPKKMQGVISRDPENPNMLRFEVTEEMFDAVLEVEEVLGKDVVDGASPLALPSP